MAIGFFGIFLGSLPDKAQLQAKIDQARHRVAEWERMPKSDLFFKIEIEHDERDQPEKLGDEICRQLMKFYGVRSAELSSFTTTED
jgi:hypothetical protein